MMFRKISIIGVGLIGGSIGLACRKNKIAKKVVGIGRRVSSITRARRLGAVDEATLNLKKGITGSDLIIISAPTNLVIEKIKEAVLYIDGPAIIIDVASVEEKIVTEADKIIKNSAAGGSASGGKKLINFVGTHPMAGSDETGVAMARPDLFKGAICIITPTKFTNLNSLNKIKKFWKAIGAKIKIVSPRKHDFLVSKISHLPHLMAYNLCSTCNRNEIALAGPGFKDSTRIAKSNPKMWAEIFIHNRNNILKAKKIFDKDIKLLESYIIKKDQKRLLKKLTSAKLKRDSLG